MEGENHGLATGSSCDCQSQRSATAISLAPSCRKKISSAEGAGCGIPINDYRVANGSPPYALSQTFSIAADQQSQDMATNNFIGHDGTDGSSVFERVAAAAMPVPRLLVRMSMGSDGTAKPPSTGGRAARATMPTC